MKIIIDRKRWIRGEGADNSYLLRPSDGKMCCLGFYGCAIGIDRAYLHEKRAPHEPYMIDQGRWLFGERASVQFFSNDAERLMSINDMPGLSPASFRESEIAAIFLRHGVEVEFVN